MSIKRIFQFDYYEKKFCLLWTRGKVGESKGYFAKLSLAICPILFRWQKKHRSYRLIMFGIDAHYKCSYGGIIC